MAYFTALYFLVDNLFGQLTSERGQRYPFTLIFKGLFAYLEKNLVVILYYSLSYFHSLIHPLSFLFSTGSCFLFYFKLKLQRQKHCLLVNFLLFSATTLGEAPPPSLP